MVTLHLLMHHPLSHSLRPHLQSAHHRPVVASSATPDEHISRRQFIGIAAASAFAVSPLFRNNPVVLEEDALSDWGRVYLPIDHGVVLLDIDFVPDDPFHGFLLGTRQTLLETKYGGNTWAPCSIPSAKDEDFNYRFNSISFNGKEGWIIGKPAILLYTADAGGTWQCIPLSSQLPRDMNHWGGGGGGKINNSVERPRFFYSKAKTMCWDKAKQVPGRDPERWRIDEAGNIVCKRFHTCQGCLCFEYDHVIPFSRGGKSVVGNCQILQTRVNRLKSDKDGLDRRSLRGYSCNIKFSDEQLDIIEMAVYGNVNRPGKQCVVGRVDAILVGKKSRNHTITCNLHIND